MTLRTLLSLAVITMTAAGAAVAANVKKPAVGVNQALRDVRVYPNPWRADTHQNNKIIFAGLPNGASVKVFTISGHSVRNLEAPAGTADWDRLNASGSHVASGVYLYVVKYGDSETTGKLAIIR